MSTVRAESFFHKERKVFSLSLFKSFIHLFGYCNFHIYRKKTRAPTNVNAPILFINSMWF